MCFSETTSLSAALTACSVLTVTPSSWEPEPLSCPPPAADGLVGAGQGALPSPGARQRSLRASCADSGCPQAMRTLSWKHTLGLVTMDVELADRTLSVAVTPVQAVVLLYFQDQGEPTDP